MKSKRIGKRHIYLPDSQVKPGINTDHLEAAGNFIAERRPDVIVCAGDFADMASLGTHNEKGHIDYEGKRYLKDISAAQNGMIRLMKPFRYIKGYSPKLVLTMGNHEDRITRCVAQDPKFEGKLALSDLGYESFGWQVIPFRKVKKIDGVAYCHYFVSGKYDRPIERAAALLTKKHMSCIAGHQQGRDIAYSQRGDGKTMTAIIAGSFYEHEETYMSPQSNNHWRGIYELNEVKDGSFDEMAVSLKFLKRKYL
jgi:hypothetical protein